MLYRQIQTRAEGESLYVRYNTDANVVNGLKNSSSYELTGEKSLEIDEVYAEKIKITITLYIYIPSADMHVSAFMPHQCSLYI